MRESRAISQVTGALQRLAFRVAPRSGAFNRVRIVKQRSYVGGRFQARAQRFQRRRIGRQRTGEQ